MGRNSVITDALSCPNKVQAAEWMLKVEVFEELRRRWPVMIDLFATSANRRCSLYFSPFRDPQALGTDALLHSWDHLQVHAFSPWALIPQVFHKLRSLVRCPDDTHCSLLASTSVVSGPSGSGSGSATGPSTLSRSFQTATLPSLSSRGPQAVTLMRGGYPAICQGCRILLCSCPNWFGSSQVVSHQLPA